MQCVTAVDGHWLAELGPMFFSVKESNRSRLKQAAKEKLSQMKAELSVASQEIKAAKEEQDAQRRKSVRDIVHAMQDRSGGMRLFEFKCKGERQNIKYFTGSAILDWLISWSFCSSRCDAWNFVSSLLTELFSPSKNRLQQRAMHQPEG
ncbi:uncharacterized protein LOC135345737 [Halichondria panicea]|uniref:uncharacterized protein LOC135345737 n=1 Tax=Halichondria panicea TaxID=6063 RepID=UPI00312B6ABC